VRTQDDLNLKQLQDAGATEVVPEAIEGSLMLASHALALVGVPMRKVIRIVQDQRDARYSLLRGYFHGADDNSVDEIHHERLSTVSLPLSSLCIGKSIGHLALEKFGVRIVSLRRHGGKLMEVSQNTILEEGDTIVLSGEAAQLTLAEEELLHH
jgi:CPA2 family monovalent cation:H+ antiporter-2